MITRGAGPFFAILFIALSVSLAACGRAQRPFLIAQVCLRSEADIDRFIALMREVAAANGMTFVNSSFPAEKALTRINPSRSEAEEHRRLINIGTTGERGFGFSAGNLGLPGYQVAIGFTDEGASLQSRRFASNTVKLLRRNWSVETQTGDTGVSGMTSCQGHGTTNSGDTTPEPQ